jgi:type I restriction enzyme S subunit
VKKLSELSEVITKGTTPTSLGFSYTSSGVRFLRAQNINYGNVNFFDDDLYIDVDTHRALARSQILNGDLLVSIAGSIGRAGIVLSNNEQLNCNQAVAIVRLKKDVNKNYISHVLDSQAVKDQIRNSTVTGVISNLSLSQLGSLKIQLPPPAEQQRIAELLDTADRVLKLRESAIAKLDQLAQSLFFQIDQTASKHYKLSDISEIVSGATPKTEIKEYWNGNVYWATPAELGKLNDIFINQTVRRITNKGLASCTATLLPINSVLFSSRAPIGHIAINSVPMATNQGFKSFVVDKQLVQPLYLYYWFKQNKLLLQSIGVGATFKELSKNLISEVKIKLPSINDQNKFVNQVNNIRDLKIKNLRAIKEIRNLIASLQHQSFTVN